MVKSLRGTQSQASLDSLKMKRGPNTHKRMDGSINRSTNVVFSASRQSIHPQQGITIQMPSAVSNSL